MARALTAGMLTAIATGIVKPIFLYEAEFASGTVNLFTGHGTLSWDSKSWTGDEGLMRIESAVETSDLAALNFTVSLNGQVSSLLSLALGQVRRGKPGSVWLGLFEPDAHYLSLPGTSGNYASTPDSAAVSITGDIDIRVKAAADDWTPATAGRYIITKLGGAPQNSYYTQLLTDGILRLGHYHDGSTERFADSTVAVGAADGSVKWLRFTLDVDNGASGRAVEFYTSDDGETWTQLGATVTQAGTSSIFDSTADVRLGGEAGFFEGKVYYAELRNGIDGPVVASFDANDAAVGATSFVSRATGETWTVNQSGSPAAKIAYQAGTLIADPFLCFKGRADKPSIVPDPNSCVVGVAYESRLIDAARRRERRYTPEDQALDFPADKGFDQVAALQDTVLVFGRR